MDLFFVPFEQKFVIYRPLKKMAFIGNRALTEYISDRLGAPESTPEEPDIEEFLKSIDFWSPDPEIGSASQAQRRHPAMAVLLLTNRCNLACTYCYASAGDRPRRDLPWSLAKSAIDAALANAIKNDDDYFALSFHGGGEPLLNFDVVERAVAYARSKDLPCEISLATNGMWSETTTRFVCENIDQVTLSCDGTREVQNKQRPLPSGEGSYERVMASIRALDTANVSYGVRMTVTKEHLDRLPAGVADLCRSTRVEGIQVEPSFTVERGQYADPPREVGMAFVRAFLEAGIIAEQSGRALIYSGARPWVLADTFCRAHEEAIIVTPEGRLVGCFEATGNDHPYIEEFSIGTVDPGSVQTDPRAFQRFIDKQENRRSDCEGCFCFWHCCGDCPSRAMVSPAPDSIRCRINRDISLSWIVAQIEKGDGLWLEQQS